MPDDRTIKQSLPVEPADLEACVRDERWKREWILWPPRQNADPRYPTMAQWTVHDEANEMKMIANADTALAAAQAALRERTVSR
jgi:hypothetical protein